MEQTYLKSFSSGIIHTSRHGLGDTISAYKIYRKQEKSCWQCLLLVVKVYKVKTVVGDCRFWMLLQRHGMLSNNESIKIHSEHIHSNEAMYFYQKNINKIFCYFLIFLRDMIRCLIFLLRIIRHVTCKKVFVRVKLRLR